MRARVDREVLTVTLSSPRLDCPCCFGWSQPEVGKLIGTSGAIIGRYERGKMTLSVEVAKKLAEAFRVTLYSAVSHHK